MSSCSSCHVIDEVKILNRWMALVLASDCNIQTRLDSHIAAWQPALMADVSAE
jgi:hypothetical protein